jgi:hypothetical protein
MRAAAILLAVGLLGAVPVRAQAAQPGSAAAIHVDMYPGDGGNVDETAPSVTNASRCNGDLSNFSERGVKSWQSSDHDDVNTVNLVCATVTDAHGNVLSGESVTLSVSGDGVITDNNGPDPTLSTQSVAVGADGYAPFFVFGTVVGQLNLTFSVGSVSQSAIERWDVPLPPDARLVVCSPDHATNDPGARQGVTCTVTDGLGNPVPGVDRRLVQDRCGRRLLIARVEHHHHGHPGSGRGHGDIFRGGTDHARCVARRRHDGM